MKPRDVTPELRRDVQTFFKLREPVSAADVIAEYRMLVRHALYGQGIARDPRRAALRAIFARHGLDPVHG